MKAKPRSPGWSLRDYAELVTRGDRSMDSKYRAVRCNLPWTLHQLDFETQKGILSVAPAEPHTVGRPHRRHRAKLRRTPRPRMSALERRAGTVPRQSLAAHLSSSRGTSLARWPEM